MAEGVAFEQEEIQRIIVNLCFPVEQKVPIIPRHKKKRVIVISGPTGCGKTELSLLLARDIRGEIISADSMQVYRGMDVGTAKVTPEQKGDIPHHLIDNCNVNDVFNVVDFYYEARNACEKIFARDSIPIIVGGSGFYIRTLLYGPPSGPPSIPAVRAALEKEMEQLGPLVMYERLAQLDWEYSKTITPNDKHKIIRALEIITLTDEKVSGLSWKERKNTLDYDFCCWFLDCSRPYLYQRIEKRCDEMLSNGLLEEVAYLREHGLLENQSASQAIGYRHVLEYLESPQSPDDYVDFVNKFKMDSRRYAKRQFTWFKKEPLFRWISVEDHDIETIVDIIKNDYFARH